MNEPISIAVVGLGERAIGTWFPLLRRVPGFRIVALCDPIPGRIERARTALGSPEGLWTGASYSDLLRDSRIDAIALTVRSQHQGRMAAEALEAGKHVHSEVPAAHSIDDCWRIVLAAERSGKVYALAEQTRHWGFFQEWRRMVRAGELGAPTYAEGQYFHYVPGDKFVDPESGEYLPIHEAVARGGVPSWQQSMPPIHYLPHQLSPLLSVLDDRVVEVVGMSSGDRSKAHPELATSDVQVALMRTAKGTVMRLAASFSQPHPEGNWHWYSVMGTRGRVETGRAGRDRPRAWFADRQMHDLSEVDWRYERTDAPVGAMGSGHGDADFYAHVEFRDAVRSGRQPELDAYRAAETAAPAILAAQSIANGSIPERVPDFRPGLARRVGDSPEAGARE